MSDSKMGAHVCTEERGVILTQAQTRIPKPPEGLIVRIWPYPTIESNQTEYMAAARGLASLPPGWSGRICTDSRNTLRRLFERANMKGIPDAVADAAREALDRLGDIEPVLLKGHPTRAELARGWGERESGARYAVSEWNVHVDKLCWQARADAAKIGLAPGGSGAAKEEAKRAKDEVTKRGKAENVPAIVAAALAPPVFPEGVTRAWDVIPPRAVRWARNSPRTASCCRTDSHAPHDYIDPMTRNRICGICLPWETLKGLGGLDEYREELRRRALGLPPSTKYKQIHTEEEEVAAQWLQSRATQRSA